LEISILENNRSQDDIYEIKDIIKCKSPDKKLCIAEAFTRALLGNTSTIVCIWKMDGTLVKFNSYGEEITGHLENEVIGEKWKSTLMDEESLGKTLQIFKQFQQGKVPQIHETDILSKDGSKLNILWTNSIIYDNDNSPYLGISIGVDMTEKKKTEEAIKHMAYYDTLTNLPARAMLMKELNKCITKAKKSRHKVALLFMDLDNFKNINDTHGHIQGDKLLVDFGEMITRCFTNGEMVARLGGDEFIIVLPHVESINEAIKASEKVFTQLRCPFNIDEKTVYATASIGIAIFPDDGKDALSILQNADIALFNAKSNGKNCYAIYQHEMKKNLIEKMEIENDLRNAMRNNELMLHYQPQIDITTGRINGMEALIRWKHPIRGYIPPSQFIPFAEEVGLICEIGDWVLYTACLQNKEWHNKGYEPVKFSVNISAKQFEKDDFTQRVHEILNKTGIDPRLLELEITETIAMKNYEYTIKTLKKLKEFNISVSLDDFGTGYSSLNYLNKLPVDKLKIDKSFLDNVKPGSNEEIIAKAIIILAFNMNLTIVAEGVETEEQIIFLREQKCINAQGFFFSKPLPPEKFEELLKIDKIFTTART
jgi:diguanylate cyclase (GGDEF)-like protein/PAS domain S-box-containing protein